MDSVVTINILFFLISTFRVQYHTLHLTSKAAFPVMRRRAERRGRAGTASIYSGFEKNCVKITVRMSTGERVIAVYPLVSA